MKKIFTLLILCCSGLLAAQSYHVGDLYTAPDGSQGVVFYVHPDGSGGWVVALTDASEGCPWGATGDVPELTNLHPTYIPNYNYLNLLVDTSGYANTLAIRNFQNNNPTYAAGLVDFANGWYLPSYAQISLLYGQMPLIKDALIAAGGTAMVSGSYWCSSEKDASRAYEIEYSGGCEPMNKTDSYRVRAIRSFSYEAPQQELSYAWSTGATTQDITVTPSQTTTYIVTASTSGGCADTVEHIVVVNIVEPLTFYDEVCEGEPYVGNGFVVTAAETSQPGTVIRTRTEEVNDCETTYTLELTVKASPYIDIVETACGSYEWDGQLYTSCGDYTVSYPYPEGCDSTVTLHLTITPLPEICHSPDTAIIAGTSANLWALGADIFYWTDNDGNILSVGPSLTVSPETSTQYYLIGQNYGAAVGNNLVENGDFELGNVGFGTDYVYNGMGPGQYGHRGGGAPRANRRANARSRADLPHPHA